MPKKQNFQVSKAEAITTIEQALPGTVPADILGDIDADYEQRKFESKWENSGIRPSSWNRAEFLASGQAHLLRMLFLLALRLRLLALTLRTRSSGTPP